MSDSEGLTPPSLKNAFLTALEFHRSIISEDVPRETDPTGLDLSFYEEGLTDELFEKLSLFALAVLKGNPYANLVAKRDPVQQIRQNILDSLLLAPFWEPVSRETRAVLLDAGTGSGVPGIPAALLLGACGEEPPMVLIESNEKKQFFLQRTLRDLGMDSARVFCGRLESRQLPGFLETEFPLHRRTQLVSRALAPVTKTLRWVRLLQPHLQWALFYKGPETAQREIGEIETWAQSGWELVGHSYFRFTDRESRFLQLRRTESNST